MQFQGRIHNLSFGFICIENTRHRGTDLIHKDEHEAAYFQADKPKTQIHSLFAIIILRNLGKKSLGPILFSISNSHFLTYSTEQAEKAN